MKVVCAVFDTAVQSFGQPFFVVHRGAAIRSFQDEVNRKADDNSLYQHPEDYNLHQLAEFDEETGEFKEASELLIRGKDAVKAASA